MGFKKIIFFGIFLVKINSSLFSQFSEFEISIPISSNEKDADANGYYNPYTNNFILEQQNKGIITRLLYDTLFNLKQKYTVTSDSFTFSNERKKPVFLKEYCTSSEIFEIYGSKSLIDIWQLNFEKGIDKKVASFKLQQKYKDETLIAILPGDNKVSFLTYTNKDEKILLYNYFINKEFLLQREFTLPESSLTKDEIKERGKFLSVKYSSNLYNLYVSDLKAPRNYEINTANQLFYSPSTIYILIRTPYNAGFHLLELNKNDGSVLFKNFLINKLNPEKFNTPLEKIPIAIAYDSLLILQNSNVNKFEYQFYSLNTKKLTAYFETDVDKSLNKLVHSSINQVGTYGSKDEEKEISNEKLFIRRKNKGTLFLKAAKSGNDSLLLTFGSYVYTEGIGGSILSIATLGAGNLLNYRVGLFQMVPFFTLSRNKFLYAYSKFSLLTLQPSTNTDITTSLNKIAVDKRIDDLEKNSSFIIEKGDKLFIGIFNKKSNKYNLIVY